MVLIIAENLIQSKEYQRHRKIKNHECIHINSVDNLQGLHRGMKYFLAGTWYKKKNIDKIIQMLSERDAIRITEWPY